MVIFKKIKERITSLDVDKVAFPVSGVMSFKELAKTINSEVVTKVIELLDDNYCSDAPLAGYTSCMDNLVEMLKNMLLKRKKVLW